MAKQVNAAELKSAHPKGCCKFDSCSCHYQFIYKLKYGKAKKKAQKAEDKNRTRRGT